jgi:hypothetical protein
VRPLVINDEVKANISRVVDYAFLPENYYEPGVSPQPPGDDARHVVLIPFGFRCVLSITKHDGQRFADLSISVDSMKYPNQFATWMLADLFGFTGWDGVSDAPPRDWMMHASKEEYCVRVAQLLKEPQTTKP